MPYQTRIQALPASSIDAADLLVTYQPINVTPYDKAVCWLQVLNDSNQDVAISFDGTTDHFFIAANTEMPQKLELNFNQMGQPSCNPPLLPKGLQVYVRGASAGTGRIYLFALSQMIA